MHERARALMAPLWWMLGTALASWAVLAAIGGVRLQPELFWGMLGPLAAACATWLVIARTYRSSPQRLTGVMVGGLLVKAVFFGVYVAVMLRGLDLRPTPFVTSFSGYFIALYGLEALFLKRLFAGTGYPG